MEAAVKSMKVGGIRRVIIPPSQGYQNTSQEPIPPNVRTPVPLSLFGTCILSYEEQATLCCVCCIVSSLIGCIYIKITNFVTAQAYR